MSADPVLSSMARLLRPRTLRVDRETGSLTWSPPRYWSQAALVILAAFFVLVGAIDLDLGPSEARLGLAAGERPGPLGQVVGYWAPDLWPAQVLPSFLLAQLEPGGRPSSAAVRWPAALAGLLAGLILAWRMTRVMGRGAGLILGLCWFGSIALVDRSGGIGLELIVGLGHSGYPRQRDDRRDGLDCRLLGVAGIPFGRPAAALCDRAGNRGHRPHHGSELDRVHHSASRHGGSLVVMDEPGRFTGALCDRTCTTVHPEIGVVPGPGCPRHRPAF